MSNLSALVSAPVTLPLSVCPSKRLDGAKTLLTIETALKRVQGGLYMWSCCSFRSHLIRKDNRNGLSYNVYFVRWITQANPPPQSQISAERICMSIPHYSFFLDQVKFSHQ